MAYSGTSEHSLLAKLVTLPPLIVTSSEPPLAVLPYLRIEARSFSNVAGVGAVFLPKMATIDLYVRDSTTSRLATYLGRLGARNSAGP